MIELHGCNYSILSDLGYVRQVLVSVAKQSGGRVLSDHFFKLDPGVSGVVMISESHLSIHTWPEKNYASLDVYTCNENVDFKQILIVIKEKFKPLQQHALLVKRGLPSGFQIEELQLRDKTEIPLN